MTTNEMLAVALPVGLLAWTEQRRNEIAAEHAVAGDAQALALYESCGFRTVSSGTAYRRPMPVSRAGHPGEAPS